MKRHIALEKGEKEILVQTAFHQNVLNFQSCIQILIFSINHLFRVSNSQSTEAETGEGKLFFSLFHRWIFFRQIHLFLPRIRYPETQTTSPEKENSSRHTLIWQKRKPVFEILHTFPSSFLRRQIRREINFDSDAHSPGQWNRVYLCVATFFMSKRSLFSNLGHMLMEYISQLRIPQKERILYKIYKTYGKFGHAPFGRSPSIRRRRNVM